MQAKTILRVFIGLTLLTGAYIIYKRTVWTKSKAIQYIKAIDPDFNEKAAEKMGDAYLISRAKAFRDGKTEFIVAGSKYDTKTGRAK